MLGHCGQTYLAYLGTWQDIGSLGGLGGLMGTSWVVLEASWKPQGDILGDLGGVLGGLGGVLEAMLGQDSF